ncbi:PREDICTED: cytochrome P450 6j1-like [Dinoponera quadriceps]|uniref:Cytochrome P450 6j1-like n=1 Tax=Dinoponera quadriceps TaxID=609295 RepID=A0A6P3YAS7_DINQU|nr:PREDICTED: cytochrome P450 6j1-like [Dinoponera quadriceps]
MRSTCQLAQCLAVCQPFIGIEKRDMIVAFVSLILGAVIILYLYLTRNFKYWQKRGVPCVNGTTLPGIGHMWEFVSAKITFNEFCRKIYHGNKDRSMVGFYNFSTPTLMIREPELVKTVLQTKFTNFHENALKIDPDLDPLMANNPFFTYGEKWVTGRKRLTYAFSSMRLKILLESVKQVCGEFETFLNIKLNKKEKAEVELKDLFAKYTAQVVANAGFGVNGFCFDDKKQHKSFYEIGKSFLEPSAINNMIFTLVFLIPWLGKVFRIRFLPKKVDRFFRTLVNDIMEQRRASDTQRNDFFQLMVELERTESNEFDLEVLASNAMSFFVDGYETSSSALTFVGFHLAAYPEVQKKLREEVMTVLSKHNGILTYDALREMAYMDQVISESQRIVPTIGFMNRICTDATELRGSDGIVCSVEPGTNILIPVHGLQEDPCYWENPHVFDPERFDPSKKHSIERFAFLPFGEGPRICVGMRMGLLQMKACLAVLLRKFSLELSPRMQMPLKLKSSVFLYAPVGGAWAFIKPI